MTDREEPSPAPEETVSLDVDPNAYLKRIKDKIESEVGPACGLNDIYHDDSWNGLIFQLSKIGDCFDLGKMLMGYIDKGESSDYIVLPGDKTTVISVDPKCPREKLLQVLSD